MSQALESIPVSDLPQSQPQTERPLNLRQQLFVKYYIQTTNGLEAARKAGYSGEDNVLRAMASENLTKPAIIKAINRLCDPIADAEEVLARLTKYSRSSIADVLTETGSFDIRVARENGTDDLIKSVKYDKEGNLSSLEIHDAHDATKDLARVHGLFIERTQSETLNLHIHASADDRAGKLAELIAKVGQRALPSGPEEPAK
jgi:hypothetical protein